MSKIEDSIALIRKGEKLALALNPENTNAMRPITHASLFSGIGGPEVAAAMLGWTNLFHCEINPFCRHILEYWFPKSESYEDIKQTDFTKWSGKIDVLTGTSSSQHEDDGRFFGDTADAESQRRGRLRDEGEAERTSGGNELFGICRGLPYEVGERWSSFPTVAPLHRGNDGFPFNVDCLSIPFAKWRNESIKAYGNAIVPQVMYEIFLAIESVIRQTEQS